MQKWIGVLPEWYTAGMWCMWNILGNYCVQILIDLEEKKNCASIEFYIEFPIKFNSNLWMWNAYRTNDTLTNELIPVEPNATLFLVNFPNFQCFAFNFGFVSSFCFEF